MTSRRTDTESKTTVADLIAQLQELPPDAPVRIEHGGDCCGTRVDAVLEDGVVWIEDPE